jgi:hypothetical protein
MNSLMTMRISLLCVPVPVGPLYDVAKPANLSSGTVPLTAWGAGS